MSVRHLVHVLFIPQILEKKYAKQWAKMDLKWSKIHKNPFVGRAPVHPDPVKSFSTYLDSLAGFLGDE